MSDHQSLFKRMMRKGFATLAKNMRGVLPDYIIVGVQKGGSTALYEYLNLHPDVYPAAQKELAFFNDNYGRGLEWYRSQFPSFLIKYRAKLAGKKFVTGEGDAVYIINPPTLKRIAHSLPKVKLILLLRNPVDRAYSHYNHSLRMGRETLPFEEAIDIEEKRIGKHWENMLNNKEHSSYDINVYSYLRSGIYINQVKTLMNLFPREQICIIQSEQFSADSAGTLKQVHDFLGLQHYIPTELRRHNAGRYTAMDPAIRRQLVDYFRPYNRLLYNYLGVDYDWDCERIRYAVGSRL